MGSGAFYCPRVLPLGVLFLALISSGSGHTAFGIVICLFLAGACGVFCNLLS